MFVNIFISPFSELFGRAVFLFVVLLVHTPLVVVRKARAQQRLRCRSCQKRTSSRVTCDFHLSRSTTAARSTAAIQLVLAQEQYRQDVEKRAKVGLDAATALQANRSRFSQTVLIDTTPMPEHIPKVDEIGVTSAPLMSASFFIGARCRPYNDDFMKCKEESGGKGEMDCLKEGRKVTRCATSVYVQQGPQETLDG